MYIAFVSEYNAEIAQQRSGVPYRIVQALRQAGHTVAVLQVQDNRKFPARLISRLIQAYFKVLLGGRAGWYEARYAPAMVAAYLKTAPAKRVLASTECVFSISPATVCAYQGDAPVVLWIDNIYVTYNLYPNRQDICSRSTVEAMIAERKAFAKATLVCTASTWLKDRLLQQYPDLSARLRVVPRGASLAQWPTEEAVAHAIDLRLKAPRLQLLFVNSGLWDVGRKGGPMVVETFLLLYKQLPLELHLIGDVAHEVQAYLANYPVYFWGKIDRSTSLGEQQYIARLQSAHLLFVPSIADGFGITYAEAAAWGLPSIAKQVMGVPEAVVEGITGHLLPTQASAEAFASLILKCWVQKDAYAELCKRAANHASRNFNWQQNVEHIIQLLSSTP